MNAMPHVSFWCIRLFSDLISAIDLHHKLPCARHTRSLSFLTETSVTKLCATPDHGHGAYYIKLSSFFIYKRRRGASKEGRSESPQNTDFSLVVFMFQRASYSVFIRSSFTFAAVPDHISGFAFNHNV